MRFFLVGRDKETAEVRLVSSATFVSRQGALDALGSLLADGSAAGVGDVFLVDLDVATPVVVFVPPAIVPAVGQEPATAEAGAAETPTPEAAPGVDAFAGESSLPPAADTPSTADSAAPGQPDLAEMGSWVLDAPIAYDAAEVAVETTRPEVTAEASEDVGAGLADALRRAAFRLEEEGVVAPPSVEEYAADLPVDPVGAVPEDAASPTPSSDVLDAEIPAWPWEAEVAEGAVEAGDPAQASGAFEPTDLGEAGLEDITLLAPSNAPDDMPYSLRTVVMGEYAPVEIETQPDTTEPYAPPAAEETTSPTMPDDAFAGEVPSSDAAAGTSAGEQAGYEPASQEMSGYTCDDCVYVATCPKHHQEGPETCGSFQWKSV